MVDRPRRSDAAREQAEADIGPLIDQPRQPPGTELAWIGRCRSERDAPPVVADPQAAVEALLDGDRSPGPAPTIGSPRQGEVAARPADRAVPTDPAPIVEAEDGVGAEVVGPRAPGRLGVGGGHGEPRVVPVEEAGQEGVGVLERGDPGQAQFRDEPILEGAPQPLDPTLGLGRVGPDPGDGRLVEGATWVRLRLPVSCSASVGARLRSTLKIP